MYYKFLNPGGRCIYATGKKWHLPTNGKPGKWMPRITGELIECWCGYHIMKARNLVDWLAPELWEVEIEGPVVHFEDKHVCRRARLIRRVDSWNETTARLFAADCAESVLPIFEALYPNDNRPRAAIDAARLFAFGKINRRDLCAAQDAAWDAAGAAWATAGDAAGSAAWATSWNAAGNAAWATARDAAGDAARDAAWAAWNVVGAAWGAARAAQDARDAEREYQSVSLCNYLGINTDALL